MTKSRSKKTILQSAGRVAKVVWEVPVVRSAALTWLIRIGVPAGITALIVPIVDALSQ